MRNEKNGDLPKHDLIYDKSTMKVVALACGAILCAILLSGGINYWITRTEVVNKLKTRDFVYIVESISAKVDSRIERAREVALLLAHDPVVQDWVAGAERDEALGLYVKQKMNDIAQNHDYSAVSVVSGVTGRYWSKETEGLFIKEDVPKDQWFFDIMRSGKPVTVNLDHHSVTKEHFVFLDALIGNSHRPLGVVGIGLNLKNIELAFQSYKSGAESSLWLIDAQGAIHLSDNNAQRGENLQNLIPTAIAQRIIGDFSEAKPQVLEYVDASGNTMDIIYQSTKSTDWKLVYQMPRSENAALLGQIKLNTILASSFILVVMIFVFYVVSHRIADPLERSMRLTQEMKRLVEQRTQELAGKNQEILDSIAYAQRLQRAILPSEQELAAAFDDVFVLWQPKALVSGDFYWCRRVEERVYVAVGDCTGHGVPGALMTMTASAVLNDLIDQHHSEPGDILMEMNRRIKKALHRNSENTVTDDGLEIGLCRIEGGVLTFVGAHLPLYVKRGATVEMFKGERGSIGYRSSEDISFTEQQWVIEPGDQFYFVSDGYLDQNGGDKNYSFGRNRFLRILSEIAAEDMAEQSTRLERCLHLYMGAEAQRDDITVLGFLPKSLEQKNE